MATILIVDDRPANREFLATLLGYGGHRLVEAGDGAEGLALTKAECPDLVIADILMPTMDGYEFVRQLRADPAIARTKVIFYTAHYLEREALALARTCGVCSVLTKPCEPEVVLRTVDAALGNALAPRSAPVTEAFDREHLRLLTDKLSQQADEQRKANERLTALVELGLQLGSERDPQRLLQSFCHSARDIVGARYAIVGILQGDGTHLRFFHTSGMDAETALRLSPEPRQGVLSAVLTEGRCFRLRNACGNPAKVGFPSSYPPIHSWLGTPIDSPARIHGWLAFIDKIGAEAFTDEDERLASVLAAQMGRIYENGSLYADVLHHTAELEREVAERRRTEEQLRLQGAALEAAVNGIAITDVDGAVVWVNPAFSRMTGFGFEEIRGQNPRVLKSGKHDRAFYAQLWQTLRAGQVWQGEMTNRRKDGTLYVEEQTITPVRNDRQEVTHFIAIKQDITQRKQAEEDLKEREERIRLLLDSTAEAIYGLDLEGCCTFSNQACARLLGYADAQALLGRNMHALVHHSRIDGTPYPLDQCRIFQAFRQGQDSHADDEVFWRADGTSFPVEYWSYPIRREGRIVGSVVTFLDISERKRLEDRSREAQERLEQVVSSSPAVLYTLVAAGREHRPTWISENVREMMGYTVEEVHLPNWWNERVHPEDLQQALDEIEQELFPHGRLAQEYRFRHQDGKYRWVRDEKRLLRNTAGDSVEIVGSWFDITDRKLLEDQFRQAQKMEAVGRLAGGVAHDFNNLLTVIMGYGDLLLSRLPAGDRNRELIQEMVAAGNRATGLTRQLLAFSRKTILEPKVLDLKAVVTDADKMLRRIIGEDIQLSTVADPAVGLVKVDPTQIQQVILNLAVNARDAMPQGGRLTLEVRNAELDETYVRNHPDARQGPYVLLAVSDTGCGMDAETMARIWEPFFTTKGQRGTGLGLATVYGIVKQSGGHVGVYSEVKKGTTFKVYLPRLQQRLPAEAARPSRLVMSRGSETVLLVEDEDGVRSLARLILKDCGYTILEARDGAEAVRISERHPGRIDLLVTDVVMPGPGGRELAERLRPVRPKMKVLYLSGYTDDAVIRHGILEEEVNFLQKPFAATALAQKVRAVLDDNSGGPEGATER